jgi:hypothetical protein
MLPRLMSGIRPDVRDPAGHRTSAELHGENPFEYLVALFVHSAGVAADPAAWLPWTFRATLARASPAAA